MSLDTPASAALPGPLDILRGNWLNRRRLAIALWLCLACVVWATYALFGDVRPPLDGAGRPLGLDFSALWGAGKAALVGDPANTYSLGWFIAHLKTPFGAGAQKLA